MEAASPNPLPPSSNTWDATTPSCGVPVVDWLALVDHQTAVAADTTLEEVLHRFQQENLRYIAVVDKGRVIGLCASRQVGLRLGSLYGYALFAKEPIRRCMVPNPLIIRRDQPWSDVLERVFSRTHDDFNEDVVLVDAADKFCGLISVQTLVRLQTRLLAESNACLQAHQAAVSEHNRKMTQDLMMARELQIAMLPRGLPIAASGREVGHGLLGIDSHFAPYALVSGDFLDVIAISDDALAILIGDVMGHGVQAALVTAMMRVLIQEHRHLAADPAALLSSLNRSLSSILEGCRLSTFASALALVIDVRSKTLKVSNAGHPCPILLRRTTKDVRAVDCERLENGGLLGIQRHSRYCTGETRLLSGDRLMLFTDGLFEVRGSGGEPLGLSELTRLAEELADRPREIFLKELVHTLERRSASARFEDDVCLVVLDVLERYTGELDDDSG